MEQKILFTPGPLNTSDLAKQAMQIDLGTRDTEYQSIVASMCQQLLKLAHCDDTYSLIFQQGSGTFGVESVLSTAVPQTDGVLILSNGAYGKRMASICECAGIAYDIVHFDMTKALPLEQVEEAVKASCYHYCAFVHCETTAGVLNDLDGLMKLMHKYRMKTIVDAMSSFGSMDISIQDLDIDFLVTSANKCLHGVPGVSLIFAKNETLDTCQGQARSYALDLYDQYAYMKTYPGSFRFTSPTHVLLALNQALKELEAAGGIVKRHEIYVHRQQMIQKAMEEMQFETLVEAKDQSPVITTYLIPDFLDFHDFYEAMKKEGYLLYSGKLPGIEAFRIGNIGEMSDEAIHGFLKAAKAYLGGLGHED